MLAFLLVWVLSFTEWEDFPTFNESFLMESISGLFTMMEPEEEKTIEARMIALYCGVGLFVLCLFILMIVFIIRKNKSKQSSGPSSEFKPYGDEESDQLSS